MGPQPRRTTAGYLGEAESSFSYWLITEDPTCGPPADIEGLVWRLRALAELALRLARRADV